MTCQNASFLYTNIDHRTLELDGKRVVNACNRLDTNLQVSTSFSIYSS